MSVLIPSSSAAPLYFSKLNIYNSISNSSQLFSCNSFTPLQHRKIPHCKTRHIGVPFKIESHVVHKSVARCKGHVHDSYAEEGIMSLDWDDEEIEDAGTPWEGAVVYNRSASNLHLEYCTTLERLGLGKLSTDVSKSSASLMGLRITKGVKDYPDGTPVQISIDVTRKKKKLRLDGIIKTVITLLCNRCCMPSAESVFSEFSLLLTEEPIDVPETIDMGVIYGKDRFSNRGTNAEDDDDALIDLDDQLYFPLEEKQIDISKHIRDRVHIEITLNSVCDSGCKGMCLKCGQNLNTGNCNCSKEKTKEENFGPLGNLREQMQLKQQ